jgi:hypothetical protein
MKICIPSYNRINILKEKTLKFLDDNNVDKTKIDIFLGTEEEKIQYHKIIGDYNFIIHGQNGIGAVRNYIRHHYKYKTDERYVLYMDDDIEALKTITNDVIDFEKYCMSMFEFTETKSLSLWGVYPINNPFFMKDNITVNNRYIIGCFCGEVIRRDRHDIYTDLDHGEDIQFSLEYFLRDSGVVRDNKVCIKTKYYGDGGINDSYNGLHKRLLDQTKSSIYIKERYVDMVELKKKTNVNKKKIKNLECVYDIRFNYRYKC